MLKRELVGKAVPGETLLQRPVRTILVAVCRRRTHGPAARQILPVPLHRRGLAQLEFCKQTHVLAQFFFKKKKIESVFACAPDPLGALEVRLCDEPPLGLQDVGRVLVLISGLLLLRGEGQGGIYQTKKGQQKKSIRVGNG